MIDVRDALLTVSGSPAAAILVKATAAVVLGLAAAALARHSTAALRHAVLSSAFAVLLLLPATALLAPPVSIAVPVPHRKAPLSLPRHLAQPYLPRGFAPPPQASTSWTRVLLSAWAAGTLLFLLPVAFGISQLRRLRRSALPWREAQPIADRLAAEAGFYRPVAVLIDEAVPGPIACGILRPAIVLPAEARDWRPDDLERALVHELEHIRRNDWLSHCLARVVCAMYWFHPLVWIGRRRLELEAERACDDAVLGRSEAVAYADQLVAIARRMNVAKTPLLAMANRADLSARVTAVLDARQRRGRAGALPVALACAAALLALSISPLRLVAAPQDPPPNPQGPSPLTAAVNLVMLNVTASDSSGNPVEGLAAKDFIVTEDGVPQDISIFEFQKITDAVPGGPSSYYILGYYTHRFTADTVFRNLKVTSKNPNIAKIDSRSGYFANRFPLPLTPPRTLVPDANGVIPPVLLLRIEPEYSEGARKAKYQGTVVVDVEVSATGDVTGATVKRSLGLGLDEKAVEAVHKWKFRPASKNGSAVASHTQVTVTFRLL